MQEKIDRVIKSVYDTQSDKNKLSSTLLIQQLDFLRGTVAKMRHRDRSLSDEQVRRSTSAERGYPIRSDGSNYESNYASSRERQNNY